MRASKLAPEVEVSGSTHSIYPFSINAHWECSNMRFVAIVIDMTAVPVNKRFLECFRHAVDEILAIALDMEPDEIVSKQSQEQVTVLWASAKRIPIRPGNVPEMHEKSLGRP